MTDDEDDKLKWTRNQGKARYSAYCKSFPFTRLRSHCRQNSCPFKQEFRILPWHCQVPVEAISTDHHI